MAGAREALRKREDTVSRFIGSWTPGEPKLSAIPNIDEWVASKKLDGVVWTALPPKYDGKEIMPTEDQVVGYLIGLVAQQREVAQEYVTRAPRQVATAYREKIEAVLKWLPTDG